MLRGGKAAIFSVFLWSAAHPPQAVATIIVRGAEEGARQRGAEGADAVRDGDLTGDDAVMFDATGMLVEDRLRMASDAMGAGRRAEAAVAGYQWLTSLENWQRRMQAA